MTTTTYTAAERESQLQRNIDWRGAFWVASGGPALGLFSIGGIAGTTGTLAFLIWTVSMIMGFLQSFTYAEIAGLFPNKSGGAAVYGATAWLKYGKLIGPLSVWCNWLGWTPGVSPAAGSARAQAVAACTPSIRTWSLVGFQIPGVVTVSVGAAFFIGALLVL